MNKTRLTLLFSVAIAVSTPAMAADRPELDNAALEQEMSQQIPQGLRYGQELPQHVQSNDLPTDQAGIDRPQRGR